MEEKLLEKLSNLKREYSVDEIVSLMPKKDMPNIIITDCRIYNKLSTTIPLRTPIIIGKAV